MLNSFKEFKYNQQKGTKKFLDVLKSYYSLWRLNTVVCRTMEVLYGGQGGKNCGLVNTKNLGLDSGPNSLNPIFDLDFLLVQIFQP
jgi:hypothetical protein